MQGAVDITRSKQPINLSLDLLEIVTDVTIKVFVQLKITSSDFTRITTSACACMEVHINKSPYQIHAPLNCFPHEIGPTVYIGSAKTQF